MKTLSMFAAALLSATAAPALAATVMVGNPTPSGIGDCTPGCTPTLQTVYSASYFGTSPVTINSIGFYFNNLVVDPTFKIVLSTSANAVGSLSGTYAANLTGDAATFFSGVGPATADAQGFYIFAGTPFTYDPSSGDLLVQITAGSSSFVYSSYSSSSLAQRAYDFSVNSASGYVDGRGYAIDTKFDVGPAVATGAVPEPATWALMLIGFGGLGGALRRRQVAARVRFA